MNSEPATPNNEEPAQLTVLETTDLSPLDSKKPRPHDKIARLPKVLRDQINDMLADFSPASLKRKLGEDPLKYARFLNVFARLTREIVNLKKHREQGAKAATAQLQQLDKKRPWNDVEREGFLDRADDLFNFKS